MPKQKAKEIVQIRAVSGSYLNAVFALTADGKVYMAEVDHGTIKPWKKFSDIPADEKE